MKILVVDDSQLNLMFAKKYLLNLVKEEEIILSRFPLQTQQIMEQENVDILLLDVIMPEINGFDILKAVRANPKYEFIPIIMLTSLTDKESFVKSFALGASDYITKPINEDEFYARVRVAIRLREKHLSIIKLLDLTAQQNLELKETNAKLTEARLSLLQADKMAAVGHLAAGVAHEMNNPLGFVSSNFEVLRKYFSKIVDYLDFIESKFKEHSGVENDLIQSTITQIDEKYRKLKLAVVRNDIDDLLSQSQSGLKRLSDIVLSLRTFSHVDNEDEKSDYNLKEIMDQVLLMSRNGSKYVAEVETHIPEEMTVFCNKGQLAQVFINIVVNAVQAIKSQQRDGMGRIKIFADVEQDFVCIHIADDGPGIPESNYSKIFNPFFTTKEVGQGTGLGLSISYDIVVNKHKGKLEFKSAMGVGTEFIVMLPNAVANDTALLRY